MDKENEEILLREQNVNFNFEAYLYLGRGRCFKMNIREMGHAFP